MYKQRLKEYVEEDIIYQKYKLGVFPESDFDEFCINHIKDIENLLNEVEELHDKIEKANKIIDTNLELIEHLGNKIDKAIEILKLCNSQCAKETIKILKDSDVDE